MENNISALKWLATNLFAYKEPNPIEIALIKHAQEKEKQQQQGYSEEEVYNMIIDLLKRKQVGQIINYGEIEEWFKQFKKK